MDTDAGLVHATHTGGCGFCSGLGTTLRGGISMCSPLNPVKGSSIMQRIETSRASSHILRLSAGSMPNPPSSPTDDDSPVPNSTRPLERRSSVDDTLRNAGGMVNGRRKVHDAEAKPNVLGALARCGEEDLRRSGMTVLLEEVVFGQPDRRETRLIGLPPPRRARLGRVGARRPAVHGRGSGNS